jgi:hypothetical protein
MTEDSKSSFTILDKLTGKLGKVTGSILALAALGTALTTLTDVGERIRKLFNPAPVVTVTTPPDLKSCLEAKLIHPEVVSLSQWDSMEMRLRGQNDCKAKLTVYLEFKGNRILLEPPFGEPEDRREDRWEDGKLGIGAVDWQVSPPHLVRLRDSLGDRVMVNLNWVVVEADTKTKIEADTVRFWLEDDHHPTATASIGSTAPL